MWNRDLAHLLDACYIYAKILFYGKIMIVFLIAMVFDLLIKSCQNVVIVMY